MSVSRAALQGSTRLVFESVSAITSTVERMHETIARRPMPWAEQPAEMTQAHGVIASSVYRAIRGVNAAVGHVVDHSLAVLPTRIGEGAEAAAETHMKAALNGAIGDHLEATDNPLAISMALRTSQGPLTLTAELDAELAAAASPHVVLLIHGLGLSELNWFRREGQSIGDQLQEAFGWTPLYLRYNTGRHISSNGRHLAMLLDELCQAWPVPIESLTLIGHSMGGLVIRSAGWYAQASRRSWLHALRNVVCLGTPHHGSMVAKAGHMLDSTLRRVPYVEPFAIGERLSAGIRDLRHGDLLDEDWQTQSPEFLPRDRRRPVPLLSGVDYYFIAASIGQRPADALGFALGDLLVRLDSASGAHADGMRHLDVHPENCRVIHEKHHFDLLCDERVARQIIDWLR